MIWVLQPEKENSPSPKPAICLPPPTPPAVSHLLLWPSVRHFPSCNWHAQCPVYFYITFSYRSPRFFFSLSLPDVSKSFFFNATKPREHSFVHTHRHTEQRPHTLSIPIWWPQAGEKRDTHLHIPRSFQQRTQHAISQQEQIVVLYKCVRLEGTRRWSPLHASP